MLLKAVLSSFNTKQNLFQALRNFYGKSALRLALSSGEEGVKDSFMMHKLINALSVLLPKAC